MHAPASVVQRPLTRLRLPAPLMDCCLDVRFSHESLISSAWSLAVMWGRQGSMQALAGKKHEIGEDWASWQYDVRN